MFEQPVVHKEKLYVSGCGTVLEYTPSGDQWAVLPPPPVGNFTVAVLKGQLLVVGGEDESGETNTILTFDEESQQWSQTYPAMPTAVTVPAVVECQDHLIVAGGEPSDLDYVFLPDVNILNTASNLWISAQPLPSNDHYFAVSIEDAIFLVGKYESNLLRAHMSTLKSGVKLGVWETLQNIPYSFTSPVTIGNTLLIVGGRQSGSDITSIQMYNPITGQWTKVGDLPEPISDCHCTALLGKLFVFGGFCSTSVYVATVFYSS